MAAAWARAPGLLLAGAAIAGSLILEQAAAASPAAADRAAPAAARTAAIQDKHRLVVLTDIGADPDDTQSLVRLLVYANQVDLEGLIATTSTHQRHRVAPEAIGSLVATYSSVRNRLLEHEPGFPTGEHLQGLVSAGLPVYGMAGVGEGRDSAGSQRLVQAIERPDARPLWVAVWGGPNTLAQALYRIRSTHSEAETARLVSRLRVYAISDQDDSGIWLRTEFPELFYIVSPGGYGAATWGGMMAAQTGLDCTEVSNAWIARHIQQGHGPLGASYPDVAYGVEGDTPSFLSLIPNGLADPEHPDWGGWGGRYELYKPGIEQTDPTGFTGDVPVLPEPRPIWTNAVDTYAPHVPNEFGRSVKPGGQSFSGFQTTVWRWRKAFQNDFAARLDWTVKPYARANHPPVPSLSHPDRLTVRAGDGVVLNAAGSTDPDGDSLSYLWQHYPEAGSLRAPIRLDSPENQPQAFFRAPSVAKPETAHFILQVTDKGEPALTRYRRVIVTILP